MKTLIFDELKKYVKEDIIRYDVPGHKGNKEILKEMSAIFGEDFLKFDVNSMERLDNLNNAQGIIKITENNIAQIYGASTSKLLINGTTSGIQAMILGTVNSQNTILIPRNIHTSVTSALILAGANVVYAYPEYDENLSIYTYLSVKEVEKKIKNYPEIDTIFLINPSYYGISKEFSKVVKYCQKKNITILVDEAHGGHFYFDPTYATAMNCQADVSCISYHKTLGSLTQSSLMLLKTNQKNKDNIINFLKMLNTTSPSYLLMTSIEIATKYLEKNGIQKFSEIKKFVKKWKQKIDKIEGINIIDSEYLQCQESEFDFTKLLIKVDNLNLSGFDVYKILRDKYNIQVELAEFKLILVVLGIGDEEKYLKNLHDALLEISQEYKINSKIKKLTIPKLPQNQTKLNLREVFYQKTQKINLNNAKGLKCGKEIMIYPPGIGIIKIGEVFTEETINYIQKLKQENIEIQGMVNFDVFVIIN